MHSSRLFVPAFTARAAHGCWAAVLLLTLAAGPAAAQQRSRVSPAVGETRSDAGAAEGSGEPGRASTETLGLHVYTLSHQPAAEAVRLIRPLLTVRGTVEVQGRNTLHVRDSLASLTRILPVLRSFDRPGLELRISIVRASSDAGVKRFRPSAGSPLPPELERDLRQLTSSTHSFTHFDLVAEASLTSHEGEDVVYELGERYSVAFRLGRVVEEVIEGKPRKTVELQGFRVLGARGSGDVGERRPGGGSGSDGDTSRVLIHTSFPLTLDRPLALALAPTEASPSALVVIFHCRQISSPAAAEADGEE